MKARYVRVTATRLWKRTGDYVFALAEMEVDSGGKNVARGAAVTSLDSIEAGRWSNRYLVDGYDSRRGIAGPVRPRRRRPWCDGGRHFRRRSGRRKKTAKPRPTPCSTPPRATASPGRRRTSPRRITTFRSWQAAIWPTPSCRSRRGRSTFSTAATWSRSATLATPGALSCVKELEAGLRRA